MEIIEYFVCGKSEENNKNEDALLVTDDFIAVVDGVTTKNNRLFDGVTGGKKATEKICEAISVFEGDISSQQAVEILTEAVATLYEKDEPKGIAAAGAIIFSKKRKEIWSIGDCQCIINGEIHKHEKEIDRINSDVRALVLEMAKKEGKTQAELLDNDVGRSFIMPLLQKQYIFANSTGPFSYGVINGANVPDEHIIIYKVDSGDEIVLASDGYPYLKRTLAESESLLEKELKSNPLCDGEYRSTKGLNGNNKSFDDRTYIKFKV